MSNLAHHPSSAPEEIKKPKKKKHVTRRPEFGSITGVHKVALSENTQKGIGCVAGEHVTAERPWIYIDKESFQEHLEYHTESSEFLPLKKEIMMFPRQQVLVGYIPTEAEEYVEYFVCLTEKATDKVDAIITKMKKVQEERLNNAINKTVGYWESYGSEKEVDEFILKNNRPLLEVEIESKYPILPFKVQFRQTKAQDMRDGYMELRPPEDLPAIIYKRRIDADIQVTPFVTTSEVQTTCTYPTNAYTQYEYPIPKELTSLLPNPQLRPFVEKDYDKFFDILRVNGCINLYSDDYENLVINREYTNKVKVIPPKEYLCFVDMNLHGNKMISAVGWHPMWTGVFVAAYVDVAQPLYRNSKMTTDEVSKAVHDIHPVLCWSFNDELKPKLILETQREVHALSFCPYDENLLVGGTVSGQLVLWDISHKLQSVEKEEILTMKQQKYREYMFTLMSWMKNIFDLALVRPTAVSDLKYSHYGRVVSIVWMSPFHTTSKTGRLAEIEEDAAVTSLELMSAAEDGSILIWDLRRKPVAVPGGFRAVRKLKRLKKKPSALTVHESPYRILHLNLRPVYRINVGHVLENHRILSLSSFYAQFFHTTYDLENTDCRKVRLSERLMYKPLLNRANCTPRANFVVGTMEGDFIQATWEGQEFDSGEAVNFENCIFVSHGKYHDGPVVTVAYSEVQDAILTVGGKVFALWREDFKNRPILWRKGDAIYTHGAWKHFEQASLRLVRIDGYIEVWSLFYKSKQSLTCTLASNGAVHKVVTHPRKIKYDVQGLCDYRGSFRLFYNLHQSPIVMQAKKEQMSKFLTREIDRKKAFMEWQAKWNERYAAAKAVVQKVAEEQAPVFEADETQKKKPKEVQKIVKISAGQRYLEIVKEEHREREQKRIKSIILEKKQLNTQELMRQREPLRKLEEEMEIKRHKQKVKIRNSEKIFNDTIVTLFPDLIKEKPVPPPDPYSEKYCSEDKVDTIDNFQDVSIRAQDYVDEHPFYYDFNWAMVLKAGRTRRNKLEDTGDKIVHRQRYAKIREERLRELESQNVTLEPLKIHLSVMSMESKASEVSDTL